VRPIRVGPEALSTRLRRVASRTVVARRRTDGGALVLATRFSPPCLDPSEGDGRGLIRVGHPGYRWWRYRRRPGLDGDVAGTANAS
jgi:hypothetical protein